MSGLRSSRNLSAPPTLIRAGNPDLLLSRIDPGAKTDPMVPHMRLQTYLRPRFTPALAKCNVDESRIAAKCILSCVK